MSSQENKQLIKKLHQSCFPAGAEKIDRYFKKDYVDHSGWGDREGLKATLSAFLEAFPTAQFRIDDMVAEGNKVAVRSTIEVKSAAGTLKRISSTSIYRIEGGKIAEQWSHGDPLF